MEEELPVRPHSGFSVAFSTRHRSLVLTPCFRCKSVREADPTRPSVDKRPQCRSLSRFTRAELRSDLPSLASLNKVSSFKRIRTTRSDVGTPGRTGSVGPVLAPGSKRRLLVLRCYAGSRRLAPPRPERRWEARSRGPRPAALSLDCPLREDLSRCAENPPSRSESVICRER